MVPDYDEKAVIGFLGVNRELATSFVRLLEAHFETLEFVNTVAVFGCPTKVNAYAIKDAFKRLARDSKRLASVTEEIAEDL